MSIRKRVAQPMMVLVALLGLLACALPAPQLHAQEFGYALRFYGTGRDRVDRVVFPLDAPARPIDVGADFTIELWIRALPGENPQGGCSNDADAWINGHIFVDRDVYNAGDYGDYGISLSGGRVAFGVHNGATGVTICGAQDVADGVWHHLAATRSQSGALALFVDGRRDAAGAGPTGDLSYRDGRSSDYPFDPTLVIGAEKHDAGAAYPSFRGWIDELRISNNVRYTGEFTRPDGPFAADQATMGLYHFDEGGGDQITDAAAVEGGPSPGTIRYGGSPQGPEWSADTPWAAELPQGNTIATALPEPTAALTTDKATPATASADAAWSERLTHGSQFEVHGATVLKSDPESVTELRNVTAAGFEASSGDTFVFTTAPLYTPGLRYEARRTDLSDQATITLTVTATSEGRLSIRMPPGLYAVTIAARPDLPTVTPEAVPTPQQTVPATATAQGQLDSIPTPVGAGEASPAASTDSSREIQLLVGLALLVGIILVTLLWFFRKRT